MENDKTPVNNGLSKESYEVFWDDVKIPLLASINDAFIKEELSTFQKQAVIKLIEKKDRQKIYQELETNILARYRSKINFKSISNAIERHIT